MSSHAVVLELALVYISIGKEIASIPALARTSVHALHEHGVAHAAACAVVAAQHMEDAQMSQDYAWIMGPEAGTHTAHGPMHDCSTLSPSSHWGLPCLDRGSEAQD